LVSAFLIKYTRVLVFTIAELTGRDEAVAIAVKDSKALDKLLLGAVGLPAVGAVLDLDVLVVGDGLLAYRQVNDRLLIFFQACACYLRGRAQSGWHRAQS